MTFAQSRIIFLLRSYKYIKGVPVSERKNEHGQHVAIRNVNCSEESIHRQTQKISSLLSGYIPYLFPLDRTLLVGETLSNFFRTHAEKRFSEDKCPSEVLRYQGRERVRQYAKYIRRSGRCANCVALDVTFSVKNNKCIVSISSDVIPNEEGISRIQNRIKIKSPEEILALVDEHYNSLTGNSGCGLWVIQKIVRSIGGQFFAFAKDGRFFYEMSLPYFAVSEEEAQMPFYLLTEKVFGKHRCRKHFAKLLSYLSKHTPFNGNTAYYVESEAPIGAEIKHCLQRIEKNFDYHFITEKRPPKGKYDIIIRA